MSPLEITRTLSRTVDRLRFGAPVTHVYNPLVYAEASFERYLERFAKRRPEALLLGMNPGPFGMAQTGVPFRRDRRWCGTGWGSRHRWASHP